MSRLWVDTLSYGFGLVAAVTDITLVLTDELRIKDVIATSIEECVILCRVTPLCYYVSFSPDREQTCALIKNVP